MANLLRDGGVWLERQRTAHCSSPVGYSRDGATSTVSATYGRTDATLADESGLTVVARVWDFLILADELAFEPVAGDVITVDGRRHEVLDLPDEGCWRWSDPYRQTYRIHTKDIGAVA